MSKKCKNVRSRMSDFFAIFILNKLFYRDDITPYSPLNSE